MKRIIRKMEKGIVRLYFKRTIPRKYLRKMVSKIFDKYSFSEKNSEEDYLFFNMFGHHGLNIVELIRRGNLKTVSSSAFDLYEFISESETIYCLETGNWE